MSPIPGLLTRSYSGVLCELGKWIGECSPQQRPDFWSPAYSSGRPSPDAMVRWSATPSSAPGCGASRSMRAMHCDTRRPSGATTSAEVVAPEGLLVSQCIARIERLAPHPGADEGVALHRTIASGDGRPDEYAGDQKSGRCCGEHSPIHLPSSQSTPE